MTLYREEPANTFNPWAGEPIDDIKHPLNIEQLWSDDELADVSLYRPAPADAPPVGKIVVGTSVQRVAGVVRYVNELADAPPPVFTPALYAVGNFKVANADISGIDTAVNFSAAVWMDVGTYLVLFSDTQPNTEYLAKAYSDTCQALVVEKGEDYLIINASNASGSFDPAEFSLEVIRVQ